MANTQIIYIDTPLEFTANTLISEFGNITIASYNENNSNSIPPGFTFSLDLNLDRNITFVNEFISNLSDEQILEYSNNIIGEISFNYPNYVDVVFSTDHNVLPVIAPVSIASTLQFGIEENIKLNLFIVDQGVAPALTFGTANVFVSTGPESIQSTIAFGLPNRQRPVHRSLIFKNDNITKLGVDDAVEVASGILFNPSTDRISNNSIGATDITIEIDQEEFRIPLIQSGNTGQLALQSEIISQTVLNNYVQVANLSSVALSGNYSDLSGKPNLDQYLQVANVNVLIQDSVDNYLEVANANVLIQDKVDNYLEVANASIIIQDQVDNYLEVANTGPFVQRPELDSYLQVANLVNINSNIVPSANVTFDLGTADKRWKDLYLSGNTIILGNATITSNGESITLPAGSKIGTQQLDNEHMIMALSDETTVQSNTSSVLTFRAPFAMTLYQIPRASLSTASNTGSVTIDINQNGTSILDTKLTIDQSEKTSTTAVTATTFANTSIADDAEITFDIDDAGIGATGFKVTLYYRKTL